MSIVYDSYKFIVILNKTLEPGVAINAAAHMALGLVAKADDEVKKMMSFINFKDGNEIDHYPISGLSLIVLRATNSEIKKFINIARENNILYVDYLQTMTGDTFKEQLEKTKNVTNDIAIYFGVAAFSKKEILNPLTKKFSLWK